MSKISVTGTELSRALQNVLLFQDPQSKLGNRVGFKVSDGSFVVYSGDDFIICRDSVPYPESPSFSLSFFISFEETEKILEMAKLVRSGVIGFTFDKNSLSVSYDIKKGSDSLELEVEIGSWIVDWFDRYIDVDIPPSLSSAFALRPERLMKFSRVRADKLYPADLLFCDSPMENRDPILKVRVGPTFLAVIQSVDRAGVQKTLEANELSLAGLWETKKEGEWDGVLRG